MSEDDDGGDKNNNNTNASMTGVDAADGSHQEIEQMLLSEASVVEEGAGNAETTLVSSQGGVDLAVAAMDSADCELSPHHHLEATTTTQQQRQDHSSSSSSSSSMMFLSKAQFQDHFSLMYPSSSVRFRGSHVRIYEQRTTQLRLEENDEDDNNNNRGVVVVKRIKNDATIGLNFLRFVYTIVCLFFCCFLFILCFQVLLFLFMDLVAELGIVNNLAKDIPAFLGTLFAIPVFVVGLASAMTIAGTFLVDTWQGHTFLRTILLVGGGRNGEMMMTTRVLTEWIAFVVFLGIPICTMIGTLMARRDDWWEITSLTWFYCVFAYYCCFVAAVIYYEIDSALFILKTLHPPGSSWRVLFRGAVMTRQNYQFSGVQHTVRMVHPQSSDHDRQTSRQQERQRIHPYSRMTRLSCCRCLFTTLQEPQPFRSTTDILGQSRFVTANTWSLEKIFCWNHNAETIAVVRGPSALHGSQMKSSFVCAILGNLLILLLLVSVLVWLEGNAIFIFLLVVVLICCIYPHVRASVRFYDMYRALAQDDDDGSDDKKQCANSSDDHGEAGLRQQQQQRGRDVNEGGVVYQKCETFYITRPKVWFCWVMVVLEFALLYVWPLIALFVVKNYAISGIFLGTGIVTGVRHFLNVALLLKEVGSLEELSERADTHDVMSAGDDYHSDKVWSQQSRLSTILSNVSRGRVRRAWAWVFAALAFVVLVLAVASLGTTQEESVSSAEAMRILPVDDFEYEPQKGMHYPTCRLAKGLEIPGSNSTGLQDYAFLAATAYQNPLTVQKTIDDWFGADFATVEFDIVRDFRTREEGIPGGDASISYRFITFPNRFGVVVVRGSTNAWEWLTNAQLWSGAAFVVVFREVLPIGSMWTPILHRLLDLLAIIVSDTLDEIAFYKQTTSFVNYLKESGNYTKLHITGQSLGGGISIITGAQTNIPAVAISGPNAMLSRETFNPPLSTEALNEMVFNVIPDRDVVPRVDDPGDLYQRIQCRAEENDLFGCHGSVRSLCEISYTCGSGNRPVLCECVNYYGYPEPEPTGNKTFTDLCGMQRGNSGHP